jgi:hypothetical protein
MAFDAMAEKKRDTGGFCSSEQLLGAPRLQINAVALLHDHPVLPRSTVTKLCDE